MFGTELYKVKLRYIFGWPVLLLIYHSWLSERQDFEDI